MNEPIPARFAHRLSGLVFVVTDRGGEWAVGRSYDVEFRRAGKTLGTLRDVRPPRCRTASNAHKSDDRLAVEAAISFATCGPREAGHSDAEIDADPDLQEWQTLHAELGDYVPADRCLPSGEGVYWLEARN